MNEAHKIGATLHVSSAVRIGGQPCDLTGWTATARLRGKGFFHDFAPSLEVADGETFITLRAESDEQRGWRAGGAAMDIRLSAPDGYTLVTITRALSLVSSITPGL
jgi:hypothetical protein